MRAEATHPSHYVSQSILVEPIDILRYARFDLGNCLKYLIRAGHKDDKQLDLEKARYYLAYTKESYRIDPREYDAWWDRYGTMVWEFRCFDGHGRTPECVGELLDDLSAILGVESNDW